MELSSKLLDAFFAALFTTVLTWCGAVVRGCRGYIAAIHNAQKDIAEIRKHLDFPREWEDRDKRFNGSNGTE